MDKKKSGVQKCPVPYRAAVKLFESLGLEKECFGLGLEDGVPVIYEYDHEDKCPGCGGPAILDRTRLADEYDVEFAESWLPRARAMHRDFFHRKQSR
ncbi:MAG: hypothetical protein KatS3mg054_0159 [Chloroflexus sp.]|nr:MAG: hypothetical protein KatS3mg054_0159 [Chloroflexus sp.]